MLSKWNKNNLYFFCFLEVDKFKIIKKCAFVLHTHTHTHTHTHIYIYIYMKSSDAKASKCHLKFSSTMIILIKLVYLSSVISL